MSGESSLLPATLRSLFSEFPYPFFPSELPDLPIRGIAIDSRRAGPGCLFVARRGGSVDGHDFISQAVERGAVAVVGDRELDSLPVPYVQVDDACRSLTYIAAAFHDWPARKLTVVGVTGTDGKTTTCNLLYQVLLAAGLRAGLISTVNAVIGDEVLDTGFHVTTPDAHDVQHYLAKMVDAGLTHVVLETTSHGWSQHRVDACEFDIGVVTNITHEHLNEHGSYENYRAAKARLFALLARTLPKPQGNPRLAVLNRDDASYAYLQVVVDHQPGVVSLAYGLDPSAGLRAADIHYSPAGIRFTATGQGLRIEVRSPLVGAFNVSNCLAALAAGVCGLGLDPAAAARGVAALTGIPGRMERIDLGQEFTAIVDFAHTPNALRVAISAARQMTAGRVITIFGSAGLRDRAKRRMMAETSVELADISILTAEDPRTESLDGILSEMADGARARGGVEEQSFWRVRDRGAAIRLGIRLARPGDVIMACGKGHEQSMCFETTEYPWDDRTAMRAALAEACGVEGPEMPFLPTQEQGE
ncbi:MAG: UDP-N-acetylmuramoyl-L-alanyl-D-glutamate--2,6-diaminopimelate ligase [Anaerolineales bacterium]|nr:UDP-N-acetylmuramoyl-L-alanyl-D-glutamate--2,6-diaminopimelate ligase [Anaerolineales bacterium]